METKQVVNRPKLPPWIKVRVGNGEREFVKGVLEDLRLNTVCSGAKCPNLGECFCSGTATFLIMGKSCTRDCKFCAIPHDSHPPLPEEDEPKRIAEASFRLKLNYVVITSVTRDDLADGGAEFFAQCITEVRKRLPNAGVEVLTPDFNEDESSILKVIEAKPTVFNHNIETVERLSSEIRSKANYRRTLRVLNKAYKLSNGEIPIKSGIMVGLGETEEEIKQTLRDLRDAGVSILTIGQYLAPSNDHWQLVRYVTPEEFELFGNYAKELGFTSVASSPLVRSSYHAGELAKKTL